MAASGIIQPAFAVDHTWFGGTGDWGLNTNWSPASVPGASDKAHHQQWQRNLVLQILGVAGLDFFGGSLLGAGNLGISGLTSFTRGQIGGDGGNVIANGGLNISGAGAKTLGHSGGSGSSGIINNGAGTWSGTGDISNWGSGRLTNSAGAKPGYPVRCRLQPIWHIHQSGHTDQIGRSDRRLRQDDELVACSTILVRSNVTQGVLSFTGGGTHTGSFGPVVQMAGSSLPAVRPSRHMT